MLFLPPRSVAHRIPGRRDPFFRDVTHVLPGAPAALVHMTSPRVIELPRRLEPVGRDTFLGAPANDTPHTVAYVGNVVALRPRDALGLRAPSGRPTPPAAA